MSCLSSILVGAGSGVGLGPEDGTKPEAERFMTGFLY